MAILGVLLLFIVLIVGWLITLFGLPGNWLMILAFVTYAFLAPAGHAEGGVWYYVGGAVVLAVIGELLEFVASAAGLAKGGSKRGAVLAMIGAIIGSLVGVAIGVPVPVVGPIIGILLFSSLGAMAGAFAGEIWKGRGISEGMAVGKAAFLGRLLGSGAKLIFGGVIVVVAMTAALRF